MITHVAVYQLTQSGWIELIKMPLDEPQEMSEKVQKTVDDVRDMFFYNNKVYLSIEGEALSVTGVEKGVASFKVKAIEGTKPNNSHIVG